MVAVTEHLTLITDHDELPRSSAVVIMTAVAWLPAATSQLTLIIWALLTASPPPSQRALRADACPYRASYTINAHA
jgi:hypothetical protein